MGILVHLQLYTFSYRKAVIRPQNMQKKQPILSIDCNVLGDIVAKLLNRNQNFYRVSRLSQGAFDSNPSKIRDVSSKEAF